MKLALFLVAPMLLCGQQPPAVVGSIKIVRGVASIHRGAQAVAAVEGAHLFAHDSLETGADGSLGLILQDGTRVSLGPNTKLDIDRFAYEPVAGNFGLVLKLARGVIAYISGKLSQFAPGSIQVETPVGI